MQPFTALLDAPGDLSKPFQIAKLGDYSDSRYGDFSITKKDVKAWQKNLGQLPGGEALIDFEHRSERAPRDSRAAGWITDIALDGDRVLATPRWTSEGEKAIKDGVYRFVSPAYGPHKNEHGVTFDNTLMSVALTNKPALTGMPAVVLASEERVSEAAAEEISRLLDMDADEALELDDVQRARLVLSSVSAATRKKAAKSGHALPDGSYPIEDVSHLHSAAVLAASKHGNWKAAKALIRRRAADLGVSLDHLPGMSRKSKTGADSRQHEMKTSALTKLLDLPEDADEATILDAVTAAKAAKAEKPSKKEARKTLEADGLVVLDQESVRKLQLDAAAGAEAMKALHAQRFETAFDKAVADRKATPGEKESLQHFYTLDADATIKLLDERQPAMPTAPAGAATIEFDPDAPDNFDAEAAQHAGLVPESVQLDAQVRKYMRDKGLGEAEYAKVFDQVLTGQVAL